MGKSKVRCSKYVYQGRMCMRLNEEPLEEVDYFKYQRSQMAAHGGCRTQNE